MVMVSRPSPSPSAPRVVPSGAKAALWPMKQPGADWSTPSTVIWFSIARAHSRVRQCSSLFGPAAQPAGTYRISAPAAFCSAASAGKRSSKQVRMPSRPAGVGTGENGASPARHSSDSRQPKASYSFCLRWNPRRAPVSSSRTMVLYGRPSARSYRPAASQSPYCRAMPPSAVTNAPSSGSAARILRDCLFVFA